MSSGVYTVIRISCCTDNSDTWGAKSRLIQPIKWHGGKYFLARRIVELMAPHIHYVEPFFGGGAVLLAKSPVGTSEIVNDLNGELTNFWRVLQNRATFAEFTRIVNCMPFSEVEWNDSADYAKSSAV